MAPKTSDPFQEQIQRMMNELRKDFRPWGYQVDRSFNPPMDIYETDGDLVIVMEIAGMRAEDIQVTFEKEVLVISGRRSEPPSSRKTRLHQMEIDYGTFHRTLQIPFPLKTEDFKASYRQGFLMITVPKLPHPAARKVEVSVP